MNSLRPKRLRALTVSGHPRGQPHLSAASGLVCAHGRVYVMADDEHHLAVFRDRRSLGRLHRVFLGNLPDETEARKKRKPDVETLFLLPSPKAGVGDALISLGSGSRKNRQVGTIIPLSAQGNVAKKVHRFDLRPLYKPLRDTLGGEINIEGAIVTPDEFLLLNRGVRGKSMNAVARYRLLDLRRLMDGARGKIKPISVRRYNLGDINGIALGFTDAAALPAGGWLFSAVAEDTDDSFKDGACEGSVLGRVDCHGDLRSLHRVRLAGLGISPLPVYMVADALREGQLIPMLRKFQILPESAIYLVYLPNRTISSRVRALIDFLAQRFGPVPSWEGGW